MEQEAATTESVQDVRVRVALPALDFTVTPEVMAQLSRFLPQLAEAAMRLNKPITARIEDLSDALVPRRVLRVEVGERDDLGKIDGISVPIVLELL